MVEKSDIYNYEDESNIYREINTLLTYFLSLNVTAFVLGIITYGEKFLLWEYPLSFIGGTKTITGLPNTASWLICAQYAKVYQKIMKEYS